MSPDAKAIQTAEVAGRPWVDELHEWVTTVDHKRLGILYILYALVFLVIGGVEALIIRIQLMRPHNNFVSPEVFNRMFTMHGTTMIFFVAMPVLFGFANYLVPLMIGARDMAFPRLNALSFWLSFLGALLLYFSFLGGSGLYGGGSAPDVGWWSYAPLGARAFSPGHSSDYWTLSLLVSGFFTQTDLRISGDGCRNRVYCVRQHERVGAPHVYDRDELLRQQLFHTDHNGCGRSHGNQDF